MSWSRFSDSDIYTFPSEKGYECCACPLMPSASGGGWPDSFTTPSAEVFVDHIGHHRDANHDVPAGIEDDVLAWANEVDPTS